MSKTRKNALSWLAGVAGLIAVVYFFTPMQFDDRLRAVGIAGAATWLALTIAARLLMVEITVSPLSVLGYSLRRVDAFWISWLRTFSNQILPLSGLAVYAHQLRNKTGAPWSVLTSLATPQLFLAAFATALIGILATTISFRDIGQPALPTLAVFSVVCVGSALVSIKAAWMLEALPETLASRFAPAAQAFRMLNAKPSVLLKLIGLHLLIIFTRGGRVVWLFFVAGHGLDWQTAILLLAVAESATLIQLTPGGLGLREGAIVGAAYLVGVPADFAAAVALLDRLFTIGTTALLTAPAMYYLRRRDSLAAGGN